MQRALRLCLLDTLSLRKGISAMIQQQGGCWCLEMLNSLKGKGIMKKRYGMI